MAGMRQGLQERLAEIPAEVLRSAIDEALKAHDKDIEQMRRSLPGLSALHGFDEYGRPIKP